MRSKKRASSIMLKLLNLSLIVMVSILLLTTSGCKNGDRELPESKKPDSSALSSPSQKIYCYQMASRRSGLHYQKYGLMNDPVRHSLKRLRTTDKNTMQSL